LSKYKLKLRFHLVENNPDLDHSEKVKVNKLSQKTIEFLKEYIKKELTEGIMSFNKNVKAKLITYKLDKNKNYFEVDAVFKQDPYKELENGTIASMIETISSKSTYQMNEVKQDGYLYSFSRIEILN
jgi:hypothetical protein